MTERTVEVRTTAEETVAACFYIYLMLVLS
jgi:hypothetical protein